LIGLEGKGRELDIGGISAGGETKKKKNNGAAGGYLVRKKGGKAMDKEKRSIPQERKKRGTRAFETTSEAEKGRKDPGTIQGVNTGRGWGNG